MTFGGDVGACFPVAIAAESHPFPSRTRKLSPPAPMVLGGLPPGRVGRRRNSRRRGPRPPGASSACPGTMSLLWPKPGDLLALPRRLAVATAARRHPRRRTAGKLLVAPRRRGGQAGRAQRAVNREAEAAKPARSAASCVGGRVTASAGFGTRTGAVGPAGPTASRAPTPIPPDRLVEPGSGGARPALHPAVGLTPHCRNPHRKKARGAAHGGEGAGKAGTATAL